MSDLETIQQHLIDLITDVRETKRTMFSALTQLSNEVFGLEKRIDQNDTARERGQQANDIAREKGQQRQQRILAGVWATIGLLVLINLMVLAFLIGRSVR